MLSSFDAGRRQRRAHWKRPKTMSESDVIARELAEKNKVIAHLTETLAHTRECLEIARAALERIAEGEATHGRGARDRETALEALRHI